MIRVAFEKLNPKKLQKSQKLSKIQKPKIALRVIVELKRASLTIEFFGKIELSLE
jgi:hypothetical protein